jgi:hypothetical protein
MARMTQWPMPLACTTRALTVRLRKLLVMQAMARMTRWRMPLVCTTRALTVRLRKLLVMQAMARMTQWRMPLVCTTRFLLPLAVARALKTPWPMLAALTTTLKPTVR